jgi:hypothetical protein
MNADKPERNNQWLEQFLVTFFHLVISHAQINVYGPVPAQTGLSLAKVPLGGRAAWPNTIRPQSATLPIGIPRALSSDHRHRFLPVFEVRKVNRRGGLWKCGNLALFARFPRGCGKMWESWFLLFHIFP